MILFSQTRIISSTQKPVAAGYTVTAEGAMMVADYTGGVFGVRQSITPSTTERFVGISYDSQTPLTTLPVLNEVTVASGTATILYTPVAGTIRVSYKATNAALTVAAGAPAAGEYSITGTTITVNAADNGKVLVVTYEYTPTVVQSIALQGNTLPGGPAGQYLGQVGLITAGEVYTSKWDTTVDWSGATPLIPRVGANGNVTLGGTGFIINGYVSALPSATSPWIGITLL